MARAADGFGVVIVDVEGDPPPSKGAAAQSATSDLPELAGAPSGGSTTDEMSECSFPASDPPSVWTWEVKAHQFGGGNGEH
jgi:hypothetical protein